jgi:hypothetical protein
MIVLRFNIPLRFEKPWSVQKLQKCLGKSDVQMHLNADSILSCVSLTNFVGKNIGSIALPALAMVHQ